MPQLRRKFVPFAVTAALAGGLAAGVSPVASSHPMDQTDMDHDTLKNDFDNCPTNFNPKQQDNDKDSVSKSDAIPPTQLPSQNGQIGGHFYAWVESQSLPDGSPDPRNRPIGMGGDACDEDDDNDGVPDRRSAKPEYRGQPKDNCPKQANPKQEDVDQNGKGDACDVPVLTTQAPASGTQADTMPPALQTNLGRRLRWRQFANSLAVGVTCSEACRLRGELRSGRTPLARGSARIRDKGFTWMFFELSKAGARRTRTARPTRAVLRITATDPGQNTATLTRRLTIRR